MMPRGPGRSRRTRTTLPEAGRDARAASPARFAAPQTPVRFAARMLLVWAGLAMGLCPWFPARAQSGADGALRGRVLGAFGLPARGVGLRVQSVDTGSQVQVLTDSQGEFLLVRLPPGEYTVSPIGSPTAIGAGPRRAVVALGEVTEIEVTLLISRSVPLASPGTRTGSQPGRAGPSATVTAGATGDAPVPAGAQSSRLPEDAVGWDGLEVSGATPGNESGQEDSQGEASFRGVDSTQNSSRMDGTSAEESFGGARLGAGVEEDSSAGADNEPERSAGPGSGWRSVEDGGRRAGAAFVFSQAAIREFRVSGQGDAAVYGSALYGHGVGGVITAVSRSGETRLHGMAFYNVRDSAWAATSPFNISTSYRNGVVTSGVVKPQDLRQQFGGRIGGPLRLGSLHFGQLGDSNRLGRRRSTWNNWPQPRLFYFYAFDEQRRGFPAISSPGYAGFYTLTPIQTALLANRGVAPSKVMAALNYLDGLTGIVTRRADQTVNFGRLDWQRDKGERVSFEYNRARWSNPAGARTSAVVDRGVTSLGSSFGDVDMGVARWVRFLGPALSNEVRVQYGRELQYEAAQTPLPQEPSVGPGGLPPEVSIGPQGLVFGTPAGLGRRAYPDERRFELAEVVASVRRGHLLQIGVDFSVISDHTDSLTNAEGTFSYDSGATNGKAGGLVDWITDYTFNVHAYPNGGCPSINAPIHYFCFRSYSQSFGQQGVSFGRQEWAGFVQDDWHASERLTVHAGLRYEYELLPFPQQPNAAIDAVFGARGATSVFPEDRNNFGPRLGLAWQPFGPGHGTVKVGYGVYFGRLTGATLEAALLDTAKAGAVSRVRILPTTETLCPQVSTVGFGYACSYLAAPPGAVQATTSAVVFDRRFRLPMVQQGTVSVEHGLGAGVKARVEYVTNTDRQLPNAVDINIGPSTAERAFQLRGGSGAVGVRDGETFAVPVYTARVSPSFGPVTDLVADSNATYHGMTVEARRGIGGSGGEGRGMAHGLAFRVAWTWSKAIDFGQSAGARPRSNGQFDPFTVRYDKGVSALNFPHRVVGTVVWTPGLEGLFAPAVVGHVARVIAGGWSVAAMGSEASGRGYSYQIFGGTRLPGGRESMNGSGGSTVLPTVGRNTLRLPDSANVDLRLGRVFAVRERVRLQASLQAFNVANHLNVTGVQQRAFLAGAAVDGVTPLVYQDAVTVASEGLNVQPFGTYTSSSTGLARERQVEVSLRVEF